MILSKNMGKNIKEYVNELKKGGLDYENYKKMIEEEVFTDIERNKFVYLDWFNLFDFVFLYLYENNELIFKNGNDIKNKYYIYCHIYGYVTDYILYLLLKRIIGVEIIFYNRTIIDYIRNYLSRTNIYYTIGGKIKIYNSSCIKNKDIVFVSNKFREIQEYVDTDCKKFINIIDGFSLEIPNNSGIVLVNNCYEGKIPDPDPIFIKRELEYYEIL